MNHRVYRKALLKLNEELALIPHSRTWPSSVFPSVLWPAGRILIRLNDFVERITKGRLGLETTYFDFSEALRQKNWRSLLNDTLPNRESLIYKLSLIA
jgi:hypothetical protein